MIVLEMVEEDRRPDAMIFRGKAKRLRLPDEPEGGG